MSSPKPKVRIEDPRRMRLASCLRLLPCTAACLRSTAGPVATARPCRPTTLPLRDNSMVVQPTPTPCSARVPVHSRSGGILVYLSPISILLSQVQGPEPLRPERSRTKENTLFPPRGEPSRDTSGVVPTTYLTSTCLTSIISAPAGLYVSN